MESVRLVEDNMWQSPDRWCFWNACTLLYRMSQEHFAEHDITLEVVSTIGWVKNLGLLLGGDCMKGYM